MKKDWHREFWPSGVYTVVEEEGYIYNKAENKNEWVKQLRLYTGDNISNDFFTSSNGSINVKLKNPPKFKILGVVSNLDFPIKFPLKLDNGLIIQDEYKNIYDEDED